mgnify:CR=1 FL=1
MPINENMVQEIVQEVMAKNADSRRSDWQTWHF